VAVVWWQWLRPGSSASWQHHQDHTTYYHAAAQCSLTSCWALLHGCICAGCQPLLFHDAQLLLWQLCHSDISATHAGCI
jgi:hypothetical protein